MILQNKIIFEVDFDGSTNRYYVKGRKFLTPAIHYNRYERRFYQKSLISSSDYDNKRISLEEVFERINDPEVKQEMLFHLNELLKLVSKE